jgi:hypothetical protein
MPHINALRLDLLRTMKDLWPWPKKPGAWVIFRSPDRLAIVQMIRLCLIAFTTHLTGVVSAASVAFSSVRVNQ